LSGQQLANVKHRGWHGYKARNSDEWHNRFEISHEFYRIEDAKQKSGLQFRMDARSSYEEAARIVADRYWRWKQKYLSEGYAHIYEGQSNGTYARVR
jgi:hypothetical protein